MSDLYEDEKRRRLGYEAVWASGILTPDVHANARIWRAVQAAIYGALPDADESNHDLDDELEGKAIARAAEPDIDPHRD